MSWFRRHWIAITLSLFLHVAIVAMLLVKLDENDGTADPQPVPDVIHAITMDETKVQAEVDKLRKNEELRKQQEQDRQQQLERKRQQEEQRLADAKTQREEEEKQAQERATKRQQTEAEEAKRLELLKKQKQEEEESVARLKKQREEAEKQRREEEKRVADLEAKRQEEAKRREEERQAAEKLSAEEASRKAVADRQFNESIANAEAVIQQKVERYWIRPPDSNKGLICRIAVKLIPGGDVIDAQVVESSGNTAFDRSAEAAVLKASPLPWPNDPKLSATFRNFDFEFNPDT